MTRKWIWVLLVCLVGCAQPVKTSPVVVTELAANPWKPVEQHLAADHGLQTQQVQLLQEISGKLDQLADSQPPKGLLVETNSPPIDDWQAALAGLQDAQDSLRETVDELASQIVVSTPVDDSEFFEADETESEVQAAEPVPFPVAGDSATGSSATGTTGSRWSRKHYFVRLYTAEWCGGCRVVKAREVPDIRAAGIRIELHDIDTAGRPEKVVTIPAFEIHRWNGTGWDFVSYFAKVATADEIIQRIDADIQQQAAGDRRSQRGIVAPRQPLANQAAPPAVWSVETLRNLPLADAPAEVVQALKSPATIWVDRSLPGSRVQYQIAEDGSLQSAYELGYNMAANKHLSRTGSPNNEAPWLNSGGFDDCDVSVISAYHVPGKIRVKKRRVEVPAFRNPKATLSVRKWLGEYPVGTVAAEFVRDNQTQQVVALRYRQKETAGWCAGQIDLGPMPAGYLEVSDCTKCHEDIGKHANEIDDQQEWYTTVTGLEKDGPFAFPLLVLTGNGRDGKGMINPAVEHLLEWEP